MSIRGKSPEELGFKEVLYDKKDWVATITINRPDRKNAFNAEVIAALGELNRSEALHFRMQGDVVELDLGGA